MSFHLGFHADVWLNRLKRKKAAFAVLAVIITLIAMYGAYAFIANRLYEYMFLISRFVFFNFDKPLALVFAEYVSIIVLFAWMVYWLKTVLKPKRS